MYQDHEHLEKIADDIILWKYMDFSKFVNILTTNKIWFNKIKCFEDVYEGTYPLGNRLAKNPFYKGLPLTDVGYDQLQDYEQKRLYVLCFHHNEYESAAMWSLYAKDAGIAIKTTGERLKKCFDKEERTILISPVTYIDYEKDCLPEWNLFHLGTHKRKSFSHENEIRCMYFNHGDEIDNRGEYISADCSELIEKVYISPYAPDYLLDTIKVLLDKFGLSIPVIKSPLYTISK